MRQNNFDITVKRLLKHKNKLIGINKIKEIIQDIMDSDYSENKAYKIIHQLKNRWYLVNLKKSIFLVKDPEKEYTEEQLLENFYREILKKHCKDFTAGKRYIWWLKALELNLTNFDIPEEILVVNEFKQSNETIIFSKQIILKTYETDKKSLFNLFNKFTKKVYIWKNVFPIANIELAMLESLYNTSIINKWYVEEIIKKILRKQKKALDFTVFETVLRNNKHHSSINRLYKLSIGIDTDISEKLKTLIKKFSYFIN